MGSYLQDAVPLVENDYARVHDALPFGRIHKVRTQNCKGEKGTHYYQDPFAPNESERESEFFSLTFVAAQCIQ